jgi:O-antigen ligase/polysaccharide polymerase Wzy-like membrane protein
VANTENAEALAKGTASRRRTFEIADATKSGFFWLSALFVVYCARPEDWIPGLKFIPLAKITAILAILALLVSMGRTKRTLKDVPQEGKLLLAMVVLLFLGAFLSPVWKGGAVSQATSFSKVFVAWMLAFLLITTFDRLRRIIFVQTVSVVIITVVSVIKGHNQPRLEGVIGGIYSNPNDLAFGIVLTLPFALAFLITTRNNLKRVLWCLGILIMMAALFLTASRAGFIDLVISGAVLMWHFGVRGKRRMLVAGTALACLVLMVAAGGKLYHRFTALSGDTAAEESAYGSYEQRKYLMQRALVGIEHYPVLGIGINNFNTYSGVWREVHMTYLQVCVEGGIPVLILYLMFFRKGFKNLRILRKTPNLDEQTVLFVGALHSSLVGFVVGAFFAPEAYQFFPYFTIAFTATLLQTIRERAQASATEPLQPPRRPRPFLEAYTGRRADALVPRL